MERAKVLAEVVLAEELTLRILAGEKTPWIVLLNGKSRKRRNVRLGWFESSRPVVLGGRGPSREFSVEEVDGALRSLLSQFFSSVAVQSLFWQAFRVMQSRLHRTRFVVEESDCRLLPDSKRETLWLAYIPHGAIHAKVRHTFPLGEKERPLLERFLSGDSPWPAVELTAQEARGSMAAMPFVRELGLIDPERWLRPLMIALAGVLLGFRDGSSGVECDLSDSLWQAYYASGGRMQAAKLNLPSEEAFLAEVRGLMRLRPYLDSLAYERAFDGQVHLQERGYSRRERFSALVDISGCREFVITRFVGERGALLFAPSRPAPGETDRILFFPQEIFDAVGSLNAAIGILDNDFASLQIWKSWRRLRGQRRLEQLLEKVPLFGRSVSCAEEGKEERP
ncbi:hypothetical protein KAR29_05870 [Aminithiophilus ramosus]|uniref:Uncharacterized protein n=2 Tax=Synergistales TaxID=649776 RepID=A0A9Q7EWM5_9BACT|nr:hypothetical protein [Aminithiophilus ramosus]QTX33398.1 hypothetical protein KAR29_05870 [Aminithiophilus ramosus]QVL36855.1 hypothetical protein KIH16_03480 [Synergistota bacterium]